MTPLQKYAEIRKQAGLPRYLKDIAKSPRLDEMLALRGIPLESWRPDSPVSDTLYMAKNIGANFHGRRGVLDSVEPDLRVIRRHPRQGDWARSDRPLANISRAADPRRPLSVERFSWPYGSTRRHHLAERVSERRQWKQTPQQAWQLASYT